MERVIVTSSNGVERKGSLLSTYHKGIFQRATVKLDEGSIVEVNLSKVREDLSVDPLFMALLGAFTVIAGLLFFGLCYCVFSFLLDWTFKG